MAGYTISFYALCFVFLFLTVHVLQGRSTWKSKLPPGPRGLPLLGNIFQLKRDAWHIFDEWKTTYGSIVYIHLAGQPIVVLNTKEAATELLHRRAANYSDRPRNIVAGEYLSHGLSLTLTRYGDLWRRLRRAGHTALKTDKSNMYRSIQANEAVLLAYDLLSTSDKWNDIISRFTGSSVARTIYDKPRIKSGMDPMTKEMFNIVEKFTEALYPGTHLVEIIPILEYLPHAFARWKRDAEQTYESWTSTFISYFTEVKDRMVKGEHKPCVCSIIVDQVPVILREEEAAWLSGSIYLAGYETTTATLLWFVYCMLLFPGVQQAAQDELDTVIGRSRLPSFADVEHLPYICAIVKEVLRWRPVAPFGLPHSSIEDDWYEGYYIPKGSIIIPNLWSMNRDVNTYGQDAHLFRPERHLRTKPGGNSWDSEGHVSFGIGRRVCVGRHVANNSLFISFATILWATSIKPAVDEKGNVQKPDENGEDSAGVVTKPLPFDCEFNPRFEDVKMVMQHARDAIMDEGSGGAN